MSTDTSTLAAPLYTVPAGPFKGISANAGEIAQKFDHNSCRDYLVWDTHARTRHFLDVFPPKEGWRIEVTEENLGFKMLDAFTLDPQGRPLYIDAWRFTATLKDSDGNIVNNGSTIQLMNCPMALEMGETRARSKLYQALGLPASPEPGQDDLQQQNRTANGAPSIPKVDIVPVVDDVPAAAASAPESSGTVDTATDSAAPAADESVPDAATESRQDVRTALEVGQEIHASAERELAGTEAPEHTADRDPQLPAVAVSPQPAAPAPTGSAQAKVDAKLNGAIPKGLLKQIEQRAQRAKVVVPQLTTLDQAQAFLATLVNPTAPILDATAVSQ